MLLSWVATEVSFSAISSLARGFFGKRPASATLRGNSDAIADARKSCFSDSDQLIRERDNYASVATTSVAIATFDIVIDSQPP
jgi:hypothetical protein